MILTAMLIVACLPAVAVVWAAWALFGPDSRIEPDDDADYEYGDLGS